MAVDGREISFELPGPGECIIEPGEFTFGFNSGDNELVLSGGGVRADSGWSGAKGIMIANPEGEDGPIEYFPDLFDHGETGLAFDGDSMSYTGPMLKTSPTSPTSDSGLRLPVDIGDGTISVTCP